MNVIELGSLAGAIIAILTLVHRIIHLITAIHSLITRIDQLTESVDHHARRIQRLEEVAYGL